MDAGSLFLQQLINGLSLGSVYALIALGYTMVYGIVKLINFAHGDVIFLRLKILKKIEKIPDIKIGIVT